MASVLADHWERHRCAGKCLTTGSREGQAEREEPVPGAQCTFLGQAEGGLGSQEGSGNMMGIYGRQGRGSTGRGRYEGLEAREKSWGVLPAGGGGEAPRLAWGST
jgi:hypothetical protein